MRITVLMLAAALLALSACAQGTSEFIGEHSAQQSIVAGVATDLALLSGAGVHFPAAMFDVETMVIFSDVFAATDAVPAHYPTTTMLGEDLFAGLVINTPADSVMGANIDVTFKLVETATAVAGEQYAVYRFDFDDLRWNRWGATTATIQAGATTATATLPTNGMQGFIGSVAIFKGLTTAALPAVVPTTIAGTVINASGDPLATDIGIYFLVGARRIPVPVSNGVVPTGGTVANTVNSDVAGHFTMQIPDNLIGQLVTLEFGRADPALATQTKFDMLAPATPSTAVDSMIIRYGANNVVSQRVRAGSD